MKRIFFILAFASLVFSSTFAEEKDRFVGLYSGVFDSPNGYPLSHQKEIFAEVTRGDNNVYKLKFLSAIFSRSEIQGIVENARVKDGKLFFDKSESGYNIDSISGSADADSIDIVCKTRGKEQSLCLKKIEVRSPTIAMRAPHGAVRLFDGSDTSKWINSDGSKLDWIVNGGEMYPRSLKNSDGKRIHRSAYSRDCFGAFKLHLEFMLPVAYGDGRVTRGNSGLYIGPYEIQIIDSFGSGGFWDECGALYRQIPPQVNACLEAGAWQTFDVEYRPAKFDGCKISDYPRITLYFNGVCVLKDVPCRGNTVENIHRFRGLIPTDDISNDIALGYPVNKSINDKDVKIMLQDHGDDVHFRNIWLMPISQ